MSTDTTKAKSMSKGAKKSRVVILHLSTDQLAKFPSSNTESPSPSAIKEEQSPSVQPSDHADTKSPTSNSTPLPPGANGDVEPDSTAPAKSDNKRKRGGGTLTGRKRAPPSINPDAPPRDRARPGPKRKSGVGEGATDAGAENKKGPGASANAVSSHKLGPKANTGAINAGLRALDRSGKPCKKWERHPLHIKSFTGLSWGMPSWNTISHDSGFPGDVKSDSTGSSDVRPNRSSALASEQSHNEGDNGDTMMTNGFESSPAPAVAT